MCTCLCVCLYVCVGKNWDFTAALSDFEQLRQVHAGNLTYSFTEERNYPPPEKEMARVGRPVLQRQDEVVQGEDTSREHVLCYVTGVNCLMHLLELITEFITRC